MILPCPKSTLNRVLTIPSVSMCLYGYVTLQVVAIVYDKDIYHLNLIGGVTYRYFFKIFKVCLTFLRHYALKG